MTIFRSIIRFPYLDSLLAGFPTWVRSCEPPQNVSACIIYWRVVFSACLPRHRRTRAAGLARWGPRGPLQSPLVVRYLRKISLQACEWCIYSQLIISLYHICFLDSFKSSKMRFERYFSLKCRDLFLSGCTLMTAFLKSAFTCYGLSMSVRETASHSGQISWRVAKRVVVLLIFLPSV